MTIDAVQMTVAESEQVSQLALDLLAMAGQKGGDLDPRCVLAALVRAAGNQAVWSGVSISDAIRWLKVSAIEAETRPASIDAYRLAQQRRLIERHGAPVRNFHIVSQTDRA
jgi:hypothetical protein